MNLDQNQASVDRFAGFASLVPFPIAPYRVPYRALYRVSQVSNVERTRTQKWENLTPVRPQSAAARRAKVPPARDLGLLQGALLRNGVIRKNLDQRFRFTLNRATSLAVTFSGKASTNLRLTTGTGKPVGTLSARSGKVARQFSLSPGTYILGLRGLGTRSTRYQLELTGNTAGIDLATAINLGNLNTPQSVADFVGLHPIGAFFSKQDYFRIQVSTPSRLSLGELSFGQMPYFELAQDTNGNGQIDPDNGEILNTSFNWLTGTEGISQNLASGTYYLRISADPDNDNQLISTNYKMRLQTTPLETPAGYNNAYGYGLVDASAAVAAAIGERPFSEYPPLYVNLGFLNYDQINLPEVIAKGYTGKDITVAIIDTGIDYSDIDLKNSAWINTREISNNGIDDDRNGYIDDGRGWNFSANDLGSGGVSNNPLDVDGHGTAVAKIIYDIAPDAKIMPVKVFPSFNEEGFFYNAIQDTYIASGILYAANNGADVINLSLSGSYSKTIENAIQYANSRGAVVVMATGNNGASAPSYPAGLADRYGIAVGAVDANLKVAGFSNRSGTPLNYVVAPGVDVKTIDLGKLPLKTVSGTSFSAPHVAGVVALMLDANPFLSPDQVKSLVTQTADRQRVSA